jgi:hypothetical protein
MPIAKYRIGEKMKALNRADFFAKRPVNPAPVAVPLASHGEDAGIFVKRMNATEREKFEAFMKDSPAGIAKRALFTQLVACDESGKPLFSEADLPQLTAGEWKSLDAIVDAGMKLNGIGQDQEQELKKTS